MIAKETLEGLRIPPERKKSGRPGIMIVLPLTVAAMALLLFYFLTADNSGRVPIAASGQNAPGGTDTAAGADGTAADSAAKPASSQPAKPAAPGDMLFQTSGYIVPRERIEISPRFQATVAQIVVGKGDLVKQGDLLVRLEDDEYKARVAEAQARVAQIEARVVELQNGNRPEEIERARWQIKQAEANLAVSEANLLRRKELFAAKSASQEQVDEALRARDVATAALRIAKEELTLMEKGARQETVKAAEAELAAAVAQLNTAQIYERWCTIVAPISGTILTKEVDAGELVTPQSFGGSGGPSTSFLSMADLTDLQVQVDLNEQFTSRVFLDQKCIVSPLAFPDKKYEGYVFEIAPEANRAKGTLEVKVQVLGPDRSLTPELSAQVQFLNGEQPAAKEDRARRKRRTE